MAQTESEFYRRKKSSLVVRHVSGDRIVAMLEIVSPGNKSNGHAFWAFVEKACELLEHRIHLLIVDPFPPGPRDPHGIHAAIWEQVQDDPFQPPTDQPLTVVAYECDLTTQAYIETLAVGETIPEMPLFLEPNGCVMVPLEATYETAFGVLPKRWQAVLAPTTALCLNVPPSRSPRGRGIFFTAVRMKARCLDVAIILFRPEGTLT